MDISRATDHADWFLREVWPEETCIKTYLKTKGFQHADVEDLCQDTFVRLLETSSKKRPDSVRALALTIARHFIVDHYRSGRHRCLRLVPEFDALDSSCDLTPERHAIGTSELKALQRVLDHHLTPRRREVWWLRRVERRSVKEIAEIIGIGVDTVERLLTKALRTLRDHGLSPKDSAGTNKTVA